MSENTENIGHIGPDTPVGSTITMKDGKMFVIDHHYPDRSGCALAPVGAPAQPLEGCTYAEWNKAQAGDVAVAEIHLPKDGVLLLDITIPGQAYTDQADAVREFKERDDRYQSLADQAKAAKKDRDEAQKVLNEVSAAMVNHALRKDGWPSDAPLATAADKPAQDAWQAVSLMDLKKPHIKVGVLKFLAENDPPIRTLGELTAWQADKGEFWAADITGIGKAAVDNIANATDAYWTRANADAENPETGD